MSAGVRRGGSSTSGEYCGFCPVVVLDVGVRLILWFLSVFVVETFDGIRDIFEHGEVDDAVLLVPIEIKA